MTNNTINVPRELLENIVLCYNEGEFELGTLAAECQALLSAPSPAGVDGLEVVGYVSQDDIKWRGDCTLRIKPYSDYTIPLCRLSDAQAIIDGLRVDVAEQEETANQWRELALQFDRHRMTAMAHIRAAASGDKSAIEALGVFAALPPIPGHEITAERDQQAQRIGELEGLLRAESARVDFLDAYIVTADAPDTGKVAMLADSGTLRECIDAALSAGKEGE